MHYFLAVKDNQPSLRDAVRYALQCERITDTSSEMEAGHGRVEERRCRIAAAECMEDGEFLARWPGLRTLVEVASTVSSAEGPVSSVRHYYISDEDHPHWHLDVTFKEDACRVRKGFAAQNLSTVRKLALQIVKAHDDKRSVRKRLFRRLSLSHDYLLDILKSAKI